MARKMRKVGEQGPYGTRGRGHATLHRDVAFRHEDHPKCPAGCRAGCRPHLMIAPADAAAQSRWTARGSVVPVAWRRRATTPGSAANTLAELIIGGSLASVDLASTVMRRPKASGGDGPTRQQNSADTAA